MKFFVIVLCHVTICLIPFVCAENGTATPSKSSTPSGTTKSTTTESYVTQTEEGTPVIDLCEVKGVKKRLASFTAPIHIYPFTGSKSERIYYSLYLRCSTSTRTIVAPPKVILHRNGKRKAFVIGDSRKTLDLVSSANILAATFLGDPLPKPNSSEANRKLICGDKADIAPKTRIFCLCDSSRISQNMTAELVASPFTNKTSDHTMTFPTNTCVFIFEIRAGQCCSAVSTDRQKQDDTGDEIHHGMGGGTFFVLLMFSVVFLYLGIGVAINRLLHEKRGAEQCPNYRTWKSLYERLVEGSSPLSTNVTTSYDGIENPRLGGNTQTTHSGLSRNPADYSPIGGSPPGRGYQQTGHGKLGTNPAVLGNDGNNDRLFSGSSPPLLHMRDENLLHDEDDVFIADLGEDDAAADKDVPLLRH
ncbi:unnamed protein product [Cyprideis torosa]|uniref:Uncharacterized protein n=1 Tax=Cyprideis torosa TaxID=163714 RepID=A0A7R8W775_9CRUS|nr:unnamed protein product [Cyprideis torosa]CAG0881941.1 unnamed protein product [Cyprideis torosa]